MSQITLPQSIDELLHTAAERAGRPYVWTKSGNKYEHRTFGRLAGDSWALAAALIERGHAGQQVMIYAENSYAWMVADLAVMGYVGISVGANKAWLEYDLSHALDVVDAQVLFFSRSTKPVVAKLQHQFPKLTCLSLEDDFDELLREGRTILSLTPDYLHRHVAPATATCKIVYTSGSTSIPKAVPLTLSNMFACGQGMYDRAPTGPSDSYYLFLPLHHVYAGVCIQLFSLYVGAELYFCHDIKQLAPEMRATRPTVFCGVPLVYERIVAAIDGPTMAKIERGIRLSNFLRQFGLDLRRRLFAKFHDTFGGRIKYMFSGGAILDPKIKQLFNDLGINLIEGYGLTETSALIALEHPGTRHYDSVGRPFANIKLKIVKPDASGHGEIAVKGPNVMSGYYRNAQANRVAFDSDGYFLTGDIGYLDEAQNLHVIGRQGRLIVRANGEKVNPDELITLITKLNPAVFKAKIYEDNHRLTALLYVKPHAHIDAAALIKQVNQDLPGYKRIQHHRVEMADPATQMK